MDEPDTVEKIILRPRASAPVTLSIPVDTMEALRRVAERRDMSPEALMKLYIGQGLRQDVSHASRE